MSECPLCNGPADHCGSTDNSPRVYRCVNCGFFRTAGDFSVQHYINDAPASQYTVFLTYLRQLLWMDCVKRFQAEESPPKQFAGYPAVLTEAMLKDTRKNHRFLNIADQIDNAVFVFAADEQGLLTGYQDSRSGSKPTRETAFKNKDLLILRLVGIDITGIDITSPGHPWLNNTQQYELDDDEFSKLRWPFHVSDYPAYQDLLSEMKANGFIMDSHSIGAAFKQIKLTTKGWQRFNEMQNGSIISVPISAPAFMAMEFAYSNWAYTNLFQPAVEACGFKLQTVEEKPAHGSIPGDIELKIKEAPFVLVDISHGSNGAYWEGGFAEALNKPVIYTCDETTWAKKDSDDPNDKPIKPHFDITHRRIVLWNKDNQEAEVNKRAPEELKSIIRNKIPNATMDDGTPAT